MSTMFNDWLTRRMMSAPAGSGPSNIIYQLYNYTCDGTAATAISTGIYLFDTTLYPNGWDIYFDFTAGKLNVNQPSYLRCRNSSSPYNGFSVRRNIQANEVEIQANSAGTIVGNAPAGTRVIVNVEKPDSNNKLAINIMNGDDVRSASSPIASVTSPLVIGGELSSDGTWKTDRFGICYIHSLIITAKE